MSIQPELSIIIVNWNGGDFLPDCLESIAKNPPGIPFEVVVVDNLSTDGSAEWLRSHSSGGKLENIPLRLIEPGRNLGFGAGNNLGFAQSNSEFLFILNPDTVVKDGSIDKLLETLKDYPSAGGAAPKILNADGTTQISVWGDVPTATQIIFEGLKLYSFLPRKFRGNWLFGRHWDYKSRQFVPVVSGAAIMVRRSLLLDVGGFDEDFHMYGEDLEWCIRIWRSPNKIIFEPDSEIVHFGGQSSDQRWDTSEKGLVQESSFLLFQEKTLSKSQIVRNSLAKAFVGSVFLLRSIILRRDYTYFKKLVDLQLAQAIRALKGK